MFVLMLLLLLLLVVEASREAGRAKAMHVLLDVLLGLGSDLAAEQLHVAGAGQSRELLLHDDVRELACQVLEVVDVGDAAHFALVAHERLQDLDHQCA